METSIDVCYFNATVKKQQFAVQRGQVLACILYFQVVNDFGQS